MSHLSWFTLSIIATLCFGIGGALQRFPAAHGHNRFVASFWSVFLAFVLCVIFFFHSLATTTWQLLAISALWGLFFATTRFTYYEIFRTSETNAIVPLTSVIQLVLSVATGFILFDDSVSVWQIVGIVSALGCTLLFFSRHSGIRYTTMITWLIGLVTISSLGYKIVQKYGVDSFHPNAFLTYQFGFTALFLFVVFGVVHWHDRRIWHQQLFEGGAKSGSAMSLFSFVGGYAYNIALTKGPFSLVSTIYSLYIVVTVVLGYLVLKETLTWRKVALLILALVSVVFLRLG